MQVEDRREEVRNALAEVSGRSGSDMRGRRGPRANGANRVRDNAQGQLQDQAHGPAQDEARTGARQPGPGNLSARKPGALAWERAIGVRDSGRANPRRASAPGERREAVPVRAGRNGIGKTAVAPDRRASMRKADRGQLAEEARRGRGFRGLSPDRLGGTMQGEAPARDTAGHARAPAAEVGRNPAAPVRGSGGKTGQDLIGHARNPAAQIAVQLPEVRGAALIAPPAGHHGPSGHPGKAALRLRERRGRCSRVPGPHRRAVSIAGVCEAAQARIKDQALRPAAAAREPAGQPQNRAANRTSPADRAGVPPAGPLEAGAVQAPALGRHRKAVQAAVRRRDLRESGLGVDGERADNLAFPGRFRDG